LSIVYFLRTCSRGKLAGDFLFAVWLQKYYSLRRPATIGGAVGFKKQKILWRSINAKVRLWSFFVCPQCGQKMKKECKMRCA
jgi:hypothetical protein